MTLRPLALALAVALAGCVPTGPLVRDAPTGTTPTGYPDHSADQIVTAVAASVAPVLSVAADGDLSFASPEESQSASFSLRARLADSVVVTVRGPLGIEAGRALVTPDSVFLANKLARQLLIGPLSAADALVPGASVDGRAARAALGLLVPEADVAWSVVPTDGLYQLTGRLTGGTSRSYVIDPALWRVVRVTEFDADGRQAGRQLAEAFDTVDGIVMPRRIRLEQGQTVIDIEHRRLVLNPADLRLRFTRPDDYETIHVR